MWRQQNCATRGLKMNTNASLLNSANQKRSRQRIKNNKLLQNNSCSISGTPETDKWTADATARPAPIKEKSIGDVPDGGIHKNRHYQSTSASICFANSRYSRFITRSKNWSHANSIKHQTSRPGPLWSGTGAGSVRGSGTLIVPVSVVLIGHIPGFNKRYNIINGFENPRCSTAQLLSIVTGLEVRVWLIGKSSRRSSLQLIIVPRYSKNMLLKNIIYRIRLTNSMIIFFLSFLSLIKVVISRSIRRSGLRAATASA